MHTPTDSGILLHDMKSQLAVILSTAQLLRRRLARGTATPQQTDDQLRSIEAATRRLAGTIDTFATRPE